MLAHLLTPGHHCEPVWQLCGLIPMAHPHIWLHVRLEAVQPGSRLNVDRHAAILATNHAAADSATQRLQL